jgi:hypothetical protein
LLGQSGALTRAQLAALQQAAAAQQPYAQLLLGQVQAAQQQPGLAK